MRSIFEDEDDDTGLFLMVGPRNDPPQPSVTVGTVTGFTRMEGAGKTTRKRTKMEALERIQSLPSFGGLLEESTLYGAPLAGVARALKKPLIIYEASKIGAMGLILLDPLDRLE